MAESGKSNAALDEGAAVSAAAIDDRFKDGIRKLDTMNAASMDYRQLAAMVDSMKKNVSIAKKNVINKLTRRIKILKEKKKEEEDDSVNSKLQRLIDEIAMIKSMEPTRISKFALANEDTVDNLSRKGKVTPHLLSLTRMAEDKSLKTFVQKWRSEHKDWRILANFLLSKNTSRHFKRSEQKHRITKDSLLIEKELLHKRLGTQVRELSKVNVNRPLIERVSKGKKYRKRGRDYRAEEEEAEAEAIHEQKTTGGKAEAENDRVENEQTEEFESEEGEGVGGDNPDDDDLYTFNIVDEDIDVLEQEGREVTVTDTDRSEPVDPKTKLIAAKLFSSNTLADSSDTDSDSADGDKTTAMATIDESVQLNLKAIGKSSGKSSAKNTKNADNSRRRTDLTNSERSLVDHSSVVNKETKLPRNAGTIDPFDVTSSKHPVNNRKPKAKKGTSQTSTKKDTAAAKEEEEEKGDDERKKQLRAVKFSEKLKKEMNIDRPKPVSDAQKAKANPPEMVTAVLNIEELTNQNAEVINTDSAKGNNVPVQTLRRRKKSAFFLGGADEIDESLGTSKEEQDRARKNQKATTGYKGVRKTEEKWLSSTFAESLKHLEKKSFKKKAPREAPGTDDSERFQKPSHQSQKFANKQSSKTSGGQKDNQRGAGQKFNKSQSYDKMGGKKFTKPSQGKAEPPVESLHPSWQASKKRKEQLELMKQGPQGKKIKFDD